MADEQKVREAFEAWMQSREGHPFARQFADLMWVAWQAAISHASATAEECSVVRNDPQAWLHKQGDYCEPSLRRLDSDEIARGWTQYPLYTHLPRDAKDARDAYRWRELCRQINASDPVSNEASTIRNIIDDAINLGSTCLDMHVDQAIAAKRGDGNG